MGQNVPRPTDNLLPIMMIADMSHAVVSDMPVPTGSTSRTTDLPSGFAPKTADRNASPLYTVDVALKRGIDIVVSAFLLVATAPLFALIAALVSLDGGSVFFGHSRLGRDLRSFSCLKFRTMIPNAETTLAEYLELNEEAAIEWKRDHKLAFDIRVTPAGRFLRKTSLDELPQLWNVFRGDMSLVGPRPITAQEGRRYGASLDEYAALRPGMTGLWQVSGRNDVSYDDRVAMDTRYARSRSLWTDLSILLIETPKVLLSRRGAR